MYSRDFKDFDEKERTRSAKIYVPVDLRAVAKNLSTDAEELFGRLYYDLDHRYQYKRDDGSFVHLFLMKVGNDMHCINFPYLAGVLAEKRTDDRRNKWSLWISLLSLGISIGSIALGK